MSRFERRRPFKDDSVFGNAPGQSEDATIRQANFDGNGEGGKE
jgi:hypothetical protein